MLKTRTILVIYSLRLLSELYRQISGFNHLIMIDFFRKQDLILCDFVSLITYPGLRMIQTVMWKRDKVFFVVCTLVCLIWTALGLNKPREALVHIKTCS